MLGKLFIMYISWYQNTDEWYPVYFEKKNDKVKTTNFYLEARLKKKDLGGKEVWTMSSTNYIKSAGENFED